jgi:plastocyanin
MTVTPLPPFASVQLGSSAAAFCTLPATPTALTLNNGRVRFTNTDTATHAVTAYAVPSSGSATGATCFLNAESIAPNSHLDVDLPVLGAGGFYEAFADTASKVTVLQLAGVLIS